MKVDFLGQKRKIKLIAASISIVAVLALVGLNQYYFGYLNSFFQGFLDSYSEQQAQTTEPRLNIVALIREVNADVRQKPVEGDRWYVAEADGQIVLGDAVYTGEISSATIQMANGGVVFLDEKTLVIFDSYDGATIPNVASGTAKLHIDGTTKIAISGTVTEFIGSNSDLSIASDQEKSSVTMTSGSAVMITGGEKQDLRTNVATDVPASPNDDSEKTKVSGLLASVALPGSFASPTDKLSALRSGHLKLGTPFPELPGIFKKNSNVPVPHQTDAEMIAGLKSTTESKTDTKDDADLIHTHILLFKEVYQKIRGNLYTTKPPLKSVRDSITVFWPEALKSAESLQLSQQESFNNIWYNKMAIGNSHTINLWPIGLSYWRLKNSDGAISKTGTVLVKPAVDYSMAPVVSALHECVAISKTSQAELRFDLLGTKHKPAGWLLEGRNDTFFGDYPKFIRVNTPYLKIPLKKEGQYFFRLRAVAKSGQLSQFSKPAVVIAYQPAEHVKPQKQEPAVPLADKSSNDSTPDRKISSVEASPPVGYNCTGYTTSPPLLGQAELKELPPVIEIQYNAGRESLNVVPHFEWLPIPGAKGYQVMIFHKGDPKGDSKTPVWEEFTAGQDYNWFQFQPGDYEIAVLGVNSDLKTAPPQEFLPMSIRLAPPKEIRIITSNLATDGSRTEVTISWSGHSASSQYEVQLDSSSRFRHPQKIFSSYYRTSWVSRAPGVKYVRVRSLNKAGAPVSDFSKVVKFSID